MIADVAILGAGPAGCATALALLGAGARGIVLIDRAPPSAFRVGESATPDVGPLLRRLGASSDLQTMGHRPHYATISLWGGERRVDDFLRRGAGHGWTLDRARFDNDLRAFAVERGARLIAPGRLLAVLRREGMWRIAAEGPDGGEIGLCARLLVVASGRKSPLDARLGATRRRLDRLTAYVAVVGDAPSLSGRVLVEATELGWWYATRLPDGRALIAFMSDDDLAREAGLPDVGALTRLWRQSRELRERTEEPQSGVAVAVCSAATTFRVPACGRGWLAVGDSMIGLDPLTSSGIAAALADGIAAGATLMGWLGEGAGEPSGDSGYAERTERSLRRYLDERGAAYRRERRWADRPFWARRHGTPVGRPLAGSPGDGVTPLALASERASKASMSSATST
jgi:flavin-dependent dehydrogenase